MCGISPNFIHSQDASHMSLVIAEFDGPFGAVHDSFSTHASDVDELCQLTKDVFVDMYNKPNYFDIIEGRLGATAEQPELGDLNIEDVKKSDYFFA
jgi:DNA-directed RNA polymerase